MKHLNRILVPTDLSEHSRRALSYGCRLAAEDRAALVILHVANELNAWQLSTQFEMFAGNTGQVWPLDRVVSEAVLDLNHFLEPHLANLKEVESATKRVVLGNVPECIAAMADKERADLIILSPQRNRRLRHWLGGAITDRVTRLSRCPVLSITEPLPSQPWRGKLAPLFLAGQSSAARRYRLESTTGLIRQRRSHTARREKNCFAPFKNRSMNYMRIANE
jgi:nucleotide-binding universal stress UspA family protein